MYETIILPNESLSNKKLANHGQRMECKTLYQLAAAAPPQSFTILPPLHFQTMLNFCVSLQLITVKLFFQCSRVNFYDGKLTRTSIKKLKDFLNVTL